MDSTQRTRPRSGGSPVGLVIFIILTVVFAVLAYWAFAKYQQADQAARDTATKLDASEKNLAAAMEKDKLFQKIAGVSAPDGLKADIKNALEATQAAGIGTANENSSAADALKAVPNTISTLKNIQGGLEADVNTKDAQIKSLTEQKKASEAAYEADLAAKIAEIQALQKKMADEVARLQGRIDEETAQRESVRDIYYTERDQWNQDRSKMLLHIEDLQEKLRRLNGEGAIIERADATITAYDQQNKLVTLNIGADKGVRPQMHFVVFTWDAKKNPVTKGVVEIVRVMPKVSVAQILSVEQDQAVGKGDAVYNLAGPQKKLFVFAGKPTIYTIQQWTTFIRANGGEVVNDVQRGDVVADFLITGEYDPADPMVVQLIKDARDFGVKIMKEGSLKEYMGLK